MPLARFAREHGLELRFIEYMPLDAEEHWQAAEVLDGEAIRRDAGSRVRAARAYCSATPQPAGDRFCVCRRRRPHRLDQSGVAAVL